MPESSLLNFIIARSSVLVNVFLSIIIVFWEGKELGFYIGKVIRVGADIVCWRLNKYFHGSCMSVRVRGELSFN